MTFTAFYEKSIYETAKDGVIAALYRLEELDRTKVVSGTHLPTLKGVKYRLEVEEITHKKYGKQYKLLSYEEVFDTEKDIIAFFSTFKGIGKKRAENIVEHFGCNAIKILDEDIERIKEVKGFKKEDKYRAFKSAYEENRGLKEVVLALSKYGISTRLAFKVYSKYKEKSLSVIHEKPYVLSGINGIDFKTADNIRDEVTKEYEYNYHRFLYAADYAIGKNAYGIFNNILKKNESGSNGMDINDFGTVMLYLLKRNILTGKDINEMTSRAIKEGHLCFVKADDRNEIYTRYTYEMEKDTADIIGRLIKNELSYDRKTVEKIIASYPIRLNASQVEAIHKAFQYDFSMIIGLPGTGKTTIIDMIARSYRKMNKKNKMYFLAPSGKAAARIRETMSHIEDIEVSTIHSALKIGVTDNEEHLKTDVVLENSLIVVDEVSMMDSHIAHILLSAVGKNSKVVFCGDDEQLPSVGPGAVLRDLILSEVVPTTKLDRIYRQDKNSNIYQNLYAIKEGNIHLTYGDDFKFIECGSIKEIEEMMLSTYLEKIDEYGLQNVMLLSPYKKYDAGVEQLNNHVQSLINDDYTAEMTCAYHFREGDIVMQIRNDYKTEIMNGAVGVIKTVGENEQGKYLIVDYDGIEKTYTKDNIDELHLAYSFTVHKSQGSETKCVILCASNFHKPMLLRNVFYTAVTRAKYEVIIIGQKTALNTAILTADKTRRRTLLRDFISTYAKETRVVAWGIN